MSVSRNTVRGASKSRYLARRIKRRGVAGCVKRGSHRRIKAMHRAFEAFKAQGWDV